MIYLLQVSCCMVTLYVLYEFVFKDKKEHQFKRFYLLGALLISILIPLFAIPVYPEYVQAAKPVYIPNAQAIGDHDSSTFSWQSLLLPFVYVSGLLLSLMLLTRRLFNVFHLIHMGEKEIGEGHTKIITQREVSLSSFLSYILIPENRKNNLSAYELSHELNHIRQKHSWDILFIELIKIFFWFNPVLFLYEKRIVELHEFLADESTANEFGQYQYESFLIKQVSQKSRPSLTHHFHSLFKKRIDMMHTNLTTSVWQYGTIIPVIFCLLFVFACESYPVQVDDEGQFLDEAGLKQAIASGKQIDSVYVMDPNTGKEVIQYVIANSSEQINTGEPIIDSIVIFDPETGKEEIQIVKRNVDQGNALIEDMKSPVEGTVDTVITFDPETGKEEVVIVKNVPVNPIESRPPSSSSIDTVVVFDAETYKETIYIINNITGKVDTIN